MSAPIHCGDCGAVMLLRTGSPGVGIKPRMFWGCSRFPKCRGTHGAHQRTGKPLGTPADADTRDARRRAHVAFDALWKNGSMTRKGAYGWLRNVLGLDEDEAHISRLTKEQCERVMRALDRRRAARRAEPNAGNAPKEKP